MKLPTPVILTQTSSPSYVDGRPCFSPDGTTVLFMRQPIVVAPHNPNLSHAGKSEFYQVPIDSPGSEQLYFFSKDYGLTRPDWSWASRNNCIAFTPGGNSYRNQFGLLQAISNTKPGTAETVQVTGYQGTMVLSYPSWYPDGEHLALTNYGNNQLIKVSKGGAWIKDLTDTAKILAGMSSVNQQHHRRICMAAQPPQITIPGQKAEYQQDQNNIYTQHGSDAPTLFSGASPDVGRVPWWSPDGKWIAYEGNNGSGPYQVFLQKKDKSAKHAITVSDSTYGIQHPKWSPDGKSIVMAVACERRVKKQAVPLRIEMIDVSGYVS